MTEPGWDFREAHRRRLAAVREHFFDGAQARAESEAAALQRARDDVEARRLAREREEAHEAAQGAGAGFGATLREELRAQRVDVHLDARGRRVEREG